MSDSIRHECGIALVRLLKPLGHYQEKYGTPLWGFLKLSLLMEKQHNRGQDGAGVACVKLDVPPGEPFMFRERCVKANPLDRIFKGLLKGYQKRSPPHHTPGVRRDRETALRFWRGTLHGASPLRHEWRLQSFLLSSVLPRSPWPTRNLALCGNFNMTNTADLNQSLIAIGQHPIFATDTQAILEKIGFFLDEEHEDIFRSCARAASPETRYPDASARIWIFHASSRVPPTTGMVDLCSADSSAMVTRLSPAIRPASVPAYYFQNDEVIAFASERAPLCTAFDLSAEQVNEVEPGHVVVVKKRGALSSTRFTPALPRASCSFERIYFSRGNDVDIYQERKALGANLSDQVLKAVNYDWADTVFSFIPTLPRLPTTASCPPCGSSAARRLRMPSSLQPKRVVSPKRSSMI